MFRLLVDFNEVREDRVRGLPEDVEGPRALRPGDLILVHDGGDEEALGAVHSTGPDLVRVDVDWRTFGPSDRFHFVQGMWLSTTGGVTMSTTVAAQERLLHVVRDGGIVWNENEHSVKDPVPA